MTIPCSHFVSWEFCDILPLLRHQRGFLLRVWSVHCSTLIFFECTSSTHHFCKLMPSKYEVFSAEVRNLEHTLSLLVKTNSGSLMQTLVRGNFHTCSFVQTKLELLRVRYKQGEFERALLLLRLKSRVNKFLTKPDRGNKMVHDHRFSSSKNEKIKYLDCQHNMAFKFWTTTNYPHIT